MEVSSVKVLEPISDPIEAFNRAAKSVFRRRFARHELCYVSAYVWKELCRHDEIDRKEKGMPNEVNHPGIMVEPPLLEPSHVGDGMAAIMTYTRSHYLGELDHMRKWQRKFVLCQRQLASEPDNIEYREQLLRTRIDLQFYKARVAYWGPRYSSLQTAVEAWDNDEPIPSDPGPG